ASNRPGSGFVEHVQRFIESRGVQCGVVDQPIEAESRSITTYVHAPLLLNEFSLQEIFKKTPSKKYIYKLYPEGPITQHVIRVYLRLWKEISKLVGACGGNPFNLLKFLNDDNYPVHEVTLSREDIETYMEQDSVKQEYLLYIRYSSILIDPFSEPDEQGRYFDFSAFPYKQVYKGKDGKWVIPRIPLEDYKRLKLLHALGQRLNVEMPETAGLIELFETKLHSFMEEEGPELFHSDLLADSAPLEAEIIGNELQAVIVR
ncbi:MAG: opine metallophore biosynthesis dehydrogenase, partial [Tumebacillaceae bacterium]